MFNTLYVGLSDLIKARIQFREESPFAHGLPIGVFALGGPHQIGGICRGLQRHAAHEEVPVLGPPGGSVLLRDGQVVQEPNTQYLGRSCAGPNRRRLQNVWRRRPSLGLNAGSSVMSSTS